MKISHLGNNIQTIRKFRGMKQQELADKIGINMQSLSKIERGLNYPAYETLEKIMEVLDVTPNELLSGEWKYGKSIEASDLYPIKEFIQHLKFQKLLDRYDDLYSMDMFGESIEGHKYKTPYQVVKMINPNSKEDMELLSKLPWVTGKFDDEDE